MSLPGEFYVGGSDSFIHNAIAEMSGFTHMIILDEFNYRYSPSPSKAKFV
jgi:hypothetical protein